jgi:hypothetical protein
MLYAFMFAMIIRIRLAPPWYCLDAALILTTIGLSCVISTLVALITSYKSLDASAKGRKSSRILRHERRVFSYKKMWVWSKAECGGCHPVAFM